MPRKKKLPATSREKLADLMSQHPWDGPDDVDIDIGADAEDEMEATHCRILGRIDPLVPDETVFERDRSPDSLELRRAKAVLASPLSDAELLAAAVDDIARLSTPKVGPGQRPDDSTVLRKELVLSAYALHGPGTHAAVQRMAEANGVPGPWFKKWRLRLRSELLTASQEQGRVATFSDSGLRYSEPLRVRLWGRRYVEIKRREDREAPEQWGLR